MFVSTLTSIADIDPAPWNAIVAKNRLICRHEYLQAVEASRINDCRYFYPIVRDGNGIVAHACVYFIRTELDSFAKGSLKYVVNGIRRIWKDFLVLRSIECGTPVALGCTISFREGVDRAAVLTEIVRETERLARDFGVGVVLFRDFYEEELSFYDQLLCMSYSRIHNLPGAHLEIRWKSFDEYLGAMISHYRRKLLTQRKKLQKTGISVEIVKDYSTYVKSLQRLWENTYQHASEYKRERLTENFFSNIATHLAERYALILIKLNGQPIGFGLILFDDETLRTLFCGLDYTCNEEYGIYLNLLYGVVELGITKGMRDIDFGITTIEPKLDLGAVVTPIQMYMKHLSPAWNRLVPRVFEMMTPKNSLCSRNVFKK